MRPFMSAGGRVTVTGRAQEISPIGVPTVTQTVEGPIEEFEDDAP